MKTAEAIISLRPGAEFTIRDGTVEWLDKKQAEPTEAEITKEAKRLDAVKKKNELYEKKDRDDAKTDDDETSTGLARRVARLERLAGLK